MAQKVGYLALVLYTWHVAVFCVNSFDGLGVYLLGLIVDCDAVALVG